MNSEEILGLLQIMDLAKQWPQFQALHDIAQAQLVEANGKAMVELGTIAARKAKAEAETKAKAAAEAAAKAKAEEDKAQRETHAVPIREGVTYNPSEPRSMNEPAVPAESIARRES